MKKEDLKHARQYRVMWTKENAVISFPMQWCVRFNLTPTELVILRHIQFMTDGENGAFTGSIKGLCVYTNSTLPTARKACDKLHDAGWIRKDVLPRETNHKEVDWVRYRAIIPYKTKVNDRGIESRLESELMAREARGYKKPKIGDSY